MTDYLFNVPNFTSGIDDALISTAESVPMFPIMILVFAFGLIALGGTSAQRRRTGYGDMPFWCALAGVSTTFLALIMTIGAGIIDLTTLGIVIAITLMCGLWFFLSKSRGEV